MDNVVKTNINGKEFHLVFNLWALKLLEKEAGIEIGQLTEKKLNQKLKSFDFLCTFFWIAVNTHHPDVSERDIGIILDGNNFEEFAQRAMEAFSNAFPEKQESGGGDVKKK